MAKLGNYVTMTLNDLILELGIGCLGMFPLPSFSLNIIIYNKHAYKYNYIIYYV